MKNKILSNRFALIFLVLGVIFLNVLIPASKSVNNDISLSFFGIKASADSECGVQSYEMRNVKSGSQCTCNGQIIFSQSCEGSGDDCSAISCGT
ncbi:MAG TPA: hypothetical protein VGK10_19525 [Prolixibacteraceae bacterium]|jgi:hypothetical protein